MVVDENNSTKPDKETKLHISSSGSNISLDVTSSKDGWNVSFGSKDLDCTSEENLIIAHFFAMQVIAMIGHSADNPEYLKLLGKLGGMIT